MREQVMYFVHYHGWNQQWDEWVSSDRCVKETEENLEKQRLAKEVVAQSKQKRSSKGKAAHNKRKRQIGDSDESDSDSAAKGTRPPTEKKDPEDEHWRALQKEQHELRMKDLDDLDLNAKLSAYRANKAGKRPLSEQSAPEPKRPRTAPSESFQEKLKTIIIPTALKDALVEQYNVIHYDEKVIKLPKSKGLTINDILRDCLEDQTKRMNAKKDKNPVDAEDLKAMETVTGLLPFVSNGLKGFFKNTLRLNLLYNFEKPQLEALLMDHGADCDLCGIYGAEHLIRLFYILPNILIHTQGVHEHNFGAIKQCVSILTNYLTRHKHRYLRLDGQSVDGQYIAAVKQITKKYENKFRLKE